MDTIAEFSDNVGLTCKLTKERFYVSSLGNEETFALRGVNGIGIYDDIEKYNKELENYKNSDKKIKNQKVFYVVFGIFFLIFGFASLSKSTGFGVFLIFGGGFFALSPQIIPVTSTLWWGKQVSLSKPKLETYLRVILSGGERNFLFNKSEDNAVLIADFINKLEQTLTAYN